MNDNNNDDFFSDFDSEGLDPEKYKEYLKKMYKDLTGEDLNENFMELDENSTDFLQDLSDSEQQEIFDDYIKDQNMDLEINFTKMDGNLMVEEMWTPEDKSMNLKRVYQYDRYTISKLDTHIQEKIYSKRLEELVENEEFEEAAEVRDRLNSIT